MTDETFEERAKLFKAAVECLNSIIIRGDYTND